MEPEEEGNNGENNSISGSALSSVPNSGSFTEKNPLLSSILRTSPTSGLPNHENRKRRIDQTSIIDDTDNQSDEYDSPL